MFIKNDFLKFAFEEAINSVNVNSLREDVVQDTIATGMKAYAQREGMEFSKEEIEETIAKGLSALNKAGDDFKFNNRMMN